MICDILGDCYHFLDFSAAFSKIESNVLCNYVPKILVITICCISDMDSRVKLSILCYRILNSILAMNDVCSLNLKYLSLVAGVLWCCTAYKKLYFSHLLSLVYKARMHSLAHISVSYIVILYYISFRWILCCVL